MSGGSGATWGTGGAFALAAPYLGVALASGIALSVMLHCVQALWAVIGWTTPFFWKAPSLAPSDAPSALSSREPAAP